LSLQDLVGGQFWKNKPSLGFHGASSPQVGCQGPTCRMMRDAFGGLEGTLDDLTMPSQAKRFFRDLKRHLKGLDVMLEGLEVVMSTHGTF
jgi:hypothetical protein